MGPIEKQFNGESSLDKSIKSVPMAKKIASEYIELGGGQYIRKSAIERVFVEPQKNGRYKVSLCWHGGNIIKYMAKPALNDFLVALTGMEPELGESNAV